MKLIDLLVQELPKRGGWPKDAYSVLQSGYDTELYFYDENEDQIHRGINLSSQAEDVHSADINFEDYKAALAASQQPIYQYMNVSLMDETWLQERWIDCSKEEFDNRNSECEPTRIVYAQQQPVIADGLHPETAELVMNFAEALARKLRKSEQKYGWSDGWKDSDWQEKCLTDFYHHIGKGDPLDVAAYCAFMVYHGWSTRPAPAINPAELVPDGPTGEIRAVLLRNIDEDK